MTLYADLLSDCALRAYHAGHGEQADNLLRLVVGRSGNDAHAVYFLGHLAYLRGRLGDAAWLLARALAMNPNNARANNDMGETLRALGHHGDAVTYLEQAIALEPALAHPYGNLAAALVALDRPEEALHWAQEALRRAADKSVAHCDLGSILGRLNRIREAIDQYDVSLTLQPDNPRTRYFRGLMRLTLDIVPDAWDEFEARFGVSGLLPPAFPKPRWTGTEDLAGRTILLHAEQGPADTIQFIRYVPLVAARGATVVVEVHPGLGAFCATIAGATRVLEIGDARPDYDLHCSLMSLPAAFRTDAHSVPAAMPYLSADPTLAANWRRLMGPWRKMRVGLAWSGGARNAAGHDGGVPLIDLEDLLEREDIEWHALQSEIDEHDRATMLTFPHLVDHSSALRDVAETAALIAAMDLVICIDATVAHIAGALHMNTWVMLAEGPDWRWMRDRVDSPWYPSMRLFRQTHRGDWTPVVEQISANLDQWAVPRA